MHDHPGGTEHTYDVLLAENGEAAVRIVHDLERQGEQVAAGFFDMRMPGGMDGLETIREIRKVQPGMLCAVVTAFTDRRVDQIAELFPSRDQWLYMNKPFTDGELVQAACHLVASWNYRRERDVALASLESANARLEEANRTLEKKVSEKTRALEDAMARLEALSITDGLTGLYVHRHVHEVLERELQAAVKDGGVLGVIFGDVDHFKEVNDTYGHVAGDAVLKDIGGLLSGIIPAGSHAARYGGEEFLVVLPEMSAADTRKIAEEIRAKVGGKAFGACGVRQPVTISLGVASYPADGTTKVELLKAADHALYLAKHRGRNTVVSATG
ncbi:MAG: diguanylate cyclase [Acidobacteriota bacterium]